MRRIVLLVMLLSSAFWMLSASTVSQEIIPLSSSIYRDMDTLYVLTGNGTPSNARPWNMNELALILSRIDVDGLHGVSRTLYDSVRTVIDKGPRYSYGDGFQFDPSVDLNVELYWHTNTVDFDKDTDWIYGFEERKPLLKLNLGFALEDYFYVFTDLQYSRNRFTDRDTFTDVGGDTGIVVGSIITDEFGAKIVDHSAVYSQSFATNVLYPSYDIDFQTPKRAVTAIGGPNWSFTLARDKIQWGNGNTGNFIIDDHVDYQEYARFVAFSDYFKYDYLNVFFETNPSVGEGSSADTSFRMFMAHRLEFRILDVITFALSENVMYANDVFSFRYLNPAFIYHNLNVNSLFNAIAHIELDYNFAKGFNAYGQYVMDQAVAPNESAEQADASGFLLGIEYATGLSKGVLTASLEYAQTSPTLYRRKGMDFLMFRRYHGNGTSFISHIDYIGYQYGGDAQVVQLDTSYAFPGNGRVSCKLFGMRQGQVDYFVSNEEVNAIRTSSPSGPEVDETFIASLSAEYGLDKIITWLDSELWLQVDWIGQRTFVKQTETEQAYTKDPRSDLQITVGIALSW